MLIKLGCVRKFSNIKGNELKIGEKKKRNLLKNKKRIYQLMVLKWV